MKPDRLLLRTKSFAYLFIGFLVLLWWSAMVHAEDTLDAPPSDGGPTEPQHLLGVRGPDEQPFQLALPRAHLLGDWLGLRSWLVNHGITPTLTFDTNSLGNPTGGIRHGFQSANNFGLGLLFDLEKLHGPKGGSFQISASGRFGNSLSHKDIGNVFSVQQLYGGETFRLVNVAYLQELLEKRLEVRLGRIAAGDDFLVSGYSCAFVQNGFCGNPVGIFFNSPGMTAYPNATWGIRAKVKPSERTYVMGGVYNGDPSIRANLYHGANWSMHGPVFAIGEAAYQANGLPGDRGLIGNYKAGFWYDDSQYTDFDTVGPGRSPSRKRGNWGVYALFDQVLVRFGEPDSNRGFGVTGSFLASPDQSISEMPYFFTAAVVTRGLFTSRPRDVAGMGVVYGYFSSQLKDSQRRQQQQVQKHELALEWNYRLSFLDDAVYFQPDVQYIIRPGGTGQISNAVVLGFQSGINF
jgi:porin